MEALRTVSPSAALCYFEYDRDDAGDILVVDRPIEGYTHYYAYDPVKRLTSETIESSVGGGQLYAFAYDYDVAGNRTYANLQGVETYYTYDAANAISLKHGLSTGYTYYGYDENGSLTALQTPSGTTYFEYGDHGLCERIVPSTGDTVYFSYDGRLSRFHMREGSTDTYFTHDGLNILEFEEGGTKTVLTHGATPVVGIGSVVQLDEGGTKYYLHNDHRGTTFKITDSGGSEIWSGLVDAFGTELASSGTNPSIFWYQGQTWFRKEIGGRVYYISPTRIYDAEDGVLEQRDVPPAVALRTVRDIAEVRLAERKHLYAYLSRSLLDSVDPTGAGGRYMSPVRRHCFQYVQKIPQEQDGDDTWISDWERVSDEGQQIVIGVHPLIQEFYEHDTEDACNPKTYKPLEWILGDWSGIWGLHGPHAQQPLESRTRQLGCGILMCLCLRTRERIYCYDRGWWRLKGDTVFIEYEGEDPMWRRAAKDKVMLNWTFVKGPPDSTIILEACKEVCSEGVRPGALRMLRLLKRKEEEE